MRQRIGRFFPVFLFVSVALIGPAAGAEALKLVERAPDPHGSPRPARDARDVPLRTSLYFEVAAPNPTTKPATTKPATTKPITAPAAPPSVAVRLQTDEGDDVELLGPAGFAVGASGWARTSEKAVHVYVEPGGQLKPATRYTVRVSSAAEGGAGPTGAGSWSFTTEAAPAVHPLEYRLDFAAQPVQWHGQFFSGVCNVIFCTRADNYGPTWELMGEARKTHPRAWGLQRDFWLTGTEDRPPTFFPSNLPNLVRERETRRIAAMEPAAGGIRLRVEDVFGHEQYGIPSGRPVGEDYHAGDEVLIADGAHDARVKVLAADSEARTVTVETFKTPEGGWKIAYDGPLPKREDPDAPGLFPPGGCYLRKYNPHGTACYYWGRLDKEWDLAHRYGRRVLANFADAPGDLSRDGKSWNTVKDYAQWHEVAGTIAGHIIDRYGKDALGFTWSIFNEPDLWILFWHASWDDLQTYYDYTTDAILRAFEDRGFDSDKVFIGGLELGAIFGTNLRLQEFLAHCSPRASARGALPKNAAVADHRLDGKRSRRVEALCREHDGKGSPCDFISIHAYNRSAGMAAKLARAKEMALEIDPAYYAKLWLNSHEACPDWMPPPDEAAADSYLGDGYFPSWCADVVHRQLLRAAADERFAYGETILTVWPPPDNFAALNAVTRVIHYREGEGRPERTTTVPMPIFHVLGLLSDMGDRFWVLPERALGGHVAGGFASRDGQGVIRVLLYTHAAQDTQSRSDASFDVTLDLDSPGWAGPASVSEYRFDRDHNSPFRLIKELTAKTAEAGKGLDAGKLPGADNGPAAAVFTRAQAERIRQACECRPIVSPIQRNGEGRVQLRARVQGNGCTFLVIGHGQSAPGERPQGGRESHPAERGH